MPSFADSPGAGPAASWPGSDQQTRQPRPGFNEVYDNPFSTPQPPSIPPVARNHTTTFCWSPFRRHGRNQPSHNSHALSSAGERAHVASPTTPEDDDDDDDDGALKISNTSPFLPRHDRRERRTMYLVASSTFKVPDDDILENDSASPGMSSQLSPPTNVLLAGIGSSPPLNTTSTVSPATTNPGSSSSRPRPSRATTPWTTPGTRPNTADPRRAFSDAWDESPLARRTMDIDRRDFFKMAVEDEDGVVVDDDFGNAGYDGDGAFGGLGAFPEEASPDQQQRQSPRLPAVPVPDDDANAAAVAASADQRTNNNQQDVEIAALLARVARLENVCQSSASCRARLRARDGRGKWTSSGRVSKKKSSTGVQGEKRRRRTELERIVHSALQFGYLGQRERKREEQEQPARRRAGIVVTGALWSRRMGRDRGGGGGGRRRRAQGP